ncbi:MAG: hypothetical protein Q8K98_01350 [Bacteroidota bacterium]|nr:hypothetical protein [Bacteroidota bacterium]
MLNPPTSLLADSTDKCRTRLNDLLDRQADKHYSPRWIYDDGVIKKTKQYPIG